MSRQKTILTGFALALAVGLAGHARAATPEDAAAQHRGDLAYADGNFAAAADHYREAIAGGAETPPMRHNLALALFRAGDPGAAAWQLERAILLEPLNPDYRAKRAVLRDRLGLPAEGRDWIGIATLALGLNSWTLLAAAGFWTFVALAAIPIAARKPLPFAWRGLRLLGLLVFVAAALAVFGHLRIRTTGLFITAEPAPLLAAPAQAAPETGTAQPGLRARRIDTHGDYVRVRTEDGQDGWARNSDWKPLFSGDGARRQESGDGGQGA